MNDQTNKPTVRLASQADEAQLMDICRNLHKENGLFAMDDERVRGMLHRAFNRQGGMIGVIDGDNEIAAVIYLLLSSFWYSRDDHIEELFAYVRPHHRKPPGHAIALIEFAKRCSEQIGIPLVIGVLSNKHMEAKVRMYRRELGAPAGAFFVFNSPVWSAQESEAFDPWRSHTRGRDWKRKLDRQMLSDGVIDLGPSIATTGLSAIPELPLRTQ